MNDNIFESLEKLEQELLDRKVGLSCHYDRVRICVGCMLGKIAHEINRFEAENKRMREALEKIAKIVQKDPNGNEFVSPEIWAAREALKELEK
jgi:hypothetical protein